MDSIITLEALRATPTPKAPTLTSQINARLIQAHHQGASCIYIDHSDGFSLYHADRTPKAITPMLLELLRELDQAGYTMTKDSDHNGRAVLRVYFRSAPAANRVTLAALEQWGAAPTQLDVKRG